MSSLLLRQRGYPSGGPLGDIDTFVDIYDICMFLQCVFVCMYIYTSGAIEFKDILRACNLKVS